VALNKKPDAVYEAVINPPDVREKSGEVNICPPSLWRRSGEGEYASAGFAEVCEDATTVKP